MNLYGLMYQWKCQGILCCTKNNTCTVIFLLHCFVVVAVPKQERGNFNFQQHILRTRLSVMVAFLCCLVDSSQLVSLEDLYNWLHLYFPRLRHLRAHSAIKKDEAKSKAVYCHLPYQPLSNELCYQLQPPTDIQRSVKTTTGICRQQIVSTCQMYYKNIVVMNGHCLVYSM